MKKVILVGGPSASGKSTFVRELNSSIYNSLAYRRVQAFFDAAASKQISKEETFKKIESEEADEWFHNICCDNECVISDIHFALQMDRNFKLDNTGADIYQEYVPTISKKLVNRLLESEIRVIAVILSCPAEILYERAVERNKVGQRELRAVSLEDVNLQIEAERKEWLNVASIEGVESIELRSDLLSPKELVERISSIIQDPKIFKLLPVKRGKHENFN